MVWRRNLQRESGGAIEPFECDLRAPDIRSLLEARGISADFSSGLAAQIEPRMAKLDRSAQAALIEGAALAAELYRETDRDLARSLRGLREVERMMGAFSGELSKLDEVLEVLAAYVRRMKTSGASAPDHGRTLH